MAFSIKKTFKLYGDGNWQRSSAQRLLLNTEKADGAYKKYKKEIMDSYLKQAGFLKWKSESYVRLNDIGLLEYIGLQKERHGGRTFTVNFAVMPLYMPLQWEETNFGTRLGLYISKKDFWWDYKDDKTARKSFENVRDAIELYLIPWFEKYSDEVEYRQTLTDAVNGNQSDYLTATSRYYEKWLAYLHAKNGNKEEVAKIFSLNEMDEKIFLEGGVEKIVSENMDRLKLPKGL
ncbi:MAG: DUF4304 domain-containing protein [Lachnospiraceae bacterium]|nr:DUF4304 domain-containing protein [Lachnospiraceae bacterium]